MRAFVFPGQGTQYVGMGVELARAFPEARELLALADRVLGEPLSQVMAEGPAERLMETEVTQPAVLVYSLALLRVLQARGLQADVAAGYSLGEYAALVAAGALDEAEAIRLVRDRALAMVEAYPKSNRSMVVVLGPEREKLDELILRCPAGEVLAAAGYCAPGLHSVSGTPAALDWLTRQLQEAGGPSAQVKSVPVTLPFHSPLLAPAQQTLRRRLEQVRLRPPRCPVVANVTAAAETDPQRIVELLVAQVVRPVRWVETMGTMRLLGVGELWEIGPGRSLSTYLRKLDRTMKRVSIEDPSSLEAALAEVAEVAPSRAPVALEAGAPEPAPAPPAE